MLRFHCRLRLSSNFRRLGIPVKSSSRQVVKSSSRQVVKSCEFSHLLFCNLSLCNVLMRNHEILHITEYELTHFHNKPTPFSRRVTGIFKSVGILFSSGYPPNTLCSVPSVTITLCRSNIANFQIIGSIPIVERQKPVVTAKTFPMMIGENHLTTGFKNHYAVGTRVQN
jgi:hypothetical protein